MRPPPRPTRLRSISHYHQPRRAQPNAHPMPPRHHAVELVTGGRGWVEHRGREVEIAPGALLWHGSGERTISRSDPDQPYRCLSVRFIYNRHAPRPVPRISQWMDLDAIRALTEQLVRCFVDERFDRAVLMDYAYARLRFQAELYHRLRPEPDVPPALLHVLDTLETRYAQPLTLDDLAAAAGWSVPHLHARFKAHFDRTPHQALIERRLRAAREQLTATNDPIKQISTDCGFTDASALCRRFRHATGVTPAAYRRRYQDPAALERV